MLPKIDLVLDFLCLKKLFQFCSFSLLNSLPLKLIVSSPHDFIPHFFPIPISASVCLFSQKKSLHSLYAHLCIHNTFIWQIQNVCYRHHPCRWSRGWITAFDGECSSLGCLICNTSWNDSVQSASLACSVFMKDNEPVCPSANMPHVFQTFIGAVVEQRRRQNCTIQCIK